MNLNFDRILVHAVFFRIDFHIAVCFFFLNVSSIDCCFSAQIIKNERGLGISVYGGIDVNVPYRGLIRIKRLFPNQPAWGTGMLQPGDILLEANEIPLTGLTNHVILSTEIRFFYAISFSFFFD